MKFDKFFQKINEKYETLNEKIKRLYEADEEEENPSDLTTAELVDEVPEEKPADEPETDETPSEEEQPVEDLSPEDLIQELDPEIITEPTKEETPAVKEEKEDESKKEDLPPKTGGPMDPIYAEVWDKYKDLHKLPIVDKIDVLISMIKEFGYATVNYKITDERNSLEVKGKIADKDKEEIKKLCDELALRTNIKDIALSQNRFQTIISFENIINATKFKDVYKYKKSEEMKKEQQKSGSFGGGFGGFGGGFGGTEVPPTTTTPELGGGEIAGTETPPPLPEAPAGE